MPRGLNIVSVTVYANGDGSASPPRIDSEGDTYIDVGLYPHLVTLCLDRAAVECLARRCEAALFEMEARRQEKLNVATIDASAARLPEREDDELLITE